MNAKRCDRCMCYFDPTEGRGEMKTVRLKNPIFSTWEDASKGKWTHYYDDENPERWIDLCPKCTNDFIEFMDFPEHRLGYIQEYETEIDDLRDMLDQSEAKRNNDYSDILGKLINRLFGVPEDYIRKQNTSFNEDLKGDSNKR